MSWGRHGWPRKNEGLRLYRERNGTYFLLDPECGHHGHSAIANVLEGTEPSLGSCNIDRRWLNSQSLKRVQWSEIPEKWQKAILPWLDEKPEDIRGFWLVDQTERIQQRGD